LKHESLKQEDDVNLEEGLRRSRADTCAISAEEASYSAAVRESLVEEERKSDALSIVKDRLREAGFEIVETDETGCPYIHIHLHVRAHTYVHVFLPVAS